jgi:hypothetical protein
VRTHDLGLANSASPSYPLMDTIGL